MICPLMVIQEKLDKHKNFLLISEIQLLNVLLNIEKGSGRVPAAKRQSIRGGSLPVKNFF